MVIQIIIFVICVLLSSFFSGSETVYTVVNTLRLKKEAEKGNKSAKRALRITDKFNETLYMLLLANNFVNIAATSVATLIGTQLFKHLDSDLAATISSFVVFAVLLVFGEILPKSICLSFNYQLSKIFAIPLRFFEIILKPIVWTVNKLVSALSVIWKKKEQEPVVTDDELMEIVDTIEEEGVINEKQGELLKSAIDFCDTAAFEIMTPRVDVFAFDIEDDINELLNDKDLFKYSRIPVFQDSIDNIIGVVKSKTILKKLVSGEKIDLHSLMTEPIYVHKSRQISSILKEFKDTHNHLAVIKDEFGGTMGIITLEDIVEELVGDIWDEMDVIEEPYKEIEDGVFIVDGGMNIDDFFDLFDIDDESSDYTTVGGWCIEKLERFAKIDDVFEYKNLTIQILKVEEFTVEQIKVTKHESESDEKEDDD